MKRIVYACVVGAVLMLGGCKDRGGFVETIDSSYDFKPTVERFKTILAQKGLRYFTQIDHAAAAKEAGLVLRQETVVFFGNPRMGTVLMQCNPTIGADLPLRMLFWQDYDGITKISFTNPEYLSLKHNIKDKKCLAIIQKAHMVMKELAEKTATKETNDAK